MAVNRTCGVPPIFTNGSSGSAAVRRPQRWNLAVLSVVGSPGNRYPQRDAFLRVSRRRLLNLPTGLSARRRVRADFCVTRSEVAGATSSGAWPGRPRSSLSADGSAPPGKTRWAGVLRPGRRHAAIVSGPATTKLKLTVLHSHITRLLPPNN